jgi:hypothetical protein
MELKLRIKKEHLLQIVIGVKTVEYRDNTIFYGKKLAANWGKKEVFIPKPFKLITLYCGNESNDLRLTAEIRFIDFVNYKSESEIPKDLENIKVGDHMFEIGIGKIIKTNVKI